MDSIFGEVHEGGATLRQLEPQWNKGMIAASIAISLLGAFTSTQLFVFSPNYNGVMACISSRC